MRLLSCHVENFGNISEEDYSFDGALTEFCKENGYGKTTLASFIKAMFYGLPIARKGSKFNDRQHFYPFRGGKFGGNLVFEMQGKEYKIERFFDRSSGAKDSVKVYCGGNVTEEFGKEPGKNIFGLDEESFLRTIFLNSEGIEISATSDISAKLNHYVDNTDEENNFDTAMEALEKAGKAMKASRGKNDRISRQQAKIHALKSEIENLTTISEELDRSYRQREELAAQIRELKEQEKEMDKRRAVLQKWEVYDTCIHSLEAEKERMAQMSQRYPKGLPKPEEIRILRTCYEKFMFLVEKMSELTGEPGNTNEWRRLSEVFADGIPSEEDFMNAERQISGLEMLRMQMQELREAEPTARQKELLDRFENRTRTENRQEAFDTYAEKRNRQSRSAFAGGKKASERTEDTGQKKRLVSIFLIFGFVLAAGGAAALFLLPFAAIWMFGFAVLAVCGALYLKILTDRAAKAQRDEEDMRLRRERADFEEYQAFCETCNRRRSILEKKEREYRELAESLGQFFDGYGMPAGEDRRGMLMRLRSDAAACRRLKEQAEEAERKKIVYGKQKRECLKSVEEIFIKYKLTATENLGEQIEELADSRAGYEHMQQNISSIEAKAEEYKVKNNLFNRPEEPETDLESHAEMLSEKRKNLAVADREIAETERRLEDLPERQNQLVTEEGRLEDYKARYEIYTAAAELLRKAEQNLRDKYIQPVREQFCNYSKVLEKTLGEKVTMDKDFRIFYERGGENRTEKHLSAGQRSICQLCFRLALMDHMFEKEKPFLIMDDPFTGLDAAHMEKIAKLLGKLAEDRQIIYFCCHDSRKVR